VFVGALVLSSCKKPTANSPEESRKDTSRNPQDKFSSSETEGAFFASNAQVGVEDSAKTGASHLTLSACVIFFDGYCSTVQGLLDWFEVDLGFTELSFIQIDLCVLCVFVLYPRVSLSTCPFWTFCTASPAR